ncbi:MAG: hypothetical protein M5U07_24425 [Xanthobacteraceae bacterium]|nr:hypothetical protein [Xanthobacteraceae bacterium]
MAEHRTGDVDHVVVGERVDHPDRCVRNWREAPGELRARVHLDLAREALDHVVEQADLLVAVVVGAEHEQVGDAAQRREPLLARARRDRVFEIVDQGVWVIADHGGRRNPWSGDW